ncbi:MAG: permease-like cell division protein FtsX [Bacilli bacterium]|nr:permease-like cell division protein FtsX [Bacilli bacterium]
MKAIRILIRSLRDSLKSIFRNFSLSIASIACTAITLILVAISLVVSFNVNKVTKELEQELTIVVYLDRETTIEQVEQIEGQIISIDNVSDVVYKSKDEWKVEMQNYSSTLDTTLSYLETNPLLDSFVVKVNDATHLKETNNQIAAIENVESSSYGEGMVEKLLSIFDIVEKVTIILVLSLVMVTAFLINNTIKLTIFSRKNEIEIMRLVGTSNTAIKLPFLFEGFFIGIIGSIIPIVLTIYGYVIAYDYFEGYLFSQIITLIKPFNFILWVSLALIAIGSLVGMFASIRAVRKYLKI